MHRVADLDERFRSIGKSDAGALLLLSTPIVSANVSLIADLALRERVAAITLFPEFAQNGGLLGYGPDLQSLFWQCGGLARKVLQGTKPEQLPIERPTHFKLVVNLNAARALGMDVPTSILLRANEVVE
jgi:putative ABC transport system substrate-binding protein